MSFTEMVSLFLEQQELAFESDTIHHLSEKVSVYVVKLNWNNSKPQREESPIAVALYIHISEMDGENEVI